MANIKNSTNLSVIYNNNYIIEGSFFYIINKRNDKLKEKINVNNYDIYSSNFLQKQIKSELEIKINK